MEKKRLNSFDTRSHNYLSFRADNITNAGFARFTGLREAYDEKLTTLSNKFILLFHTQLQQ